MKITVVKQLERVDLFDNSNNGKTSNINEATIDPTKVVADVVDDDPSIGSFAGCGWITVKRYATTNFRMNGWFDAYAYEMKEYYT